MSLAGWLNVLLGIYAAVFVAALILSWNFRICLKDNHPSAWIDISSGKYTFWGFVLTNQIYKSLNDVGLNKRAEALRISFLAVIGMLALIVALIIAGQIHNGVWDEPLVVNHPLNLIGTLMVAVSAASAVARGLALRRLRIMHPERWRQLGYPRFFTRYIFEREVWKRDVGDLNDSRLNFLIQFKFICAACASVIFIGAVAGIWHT